MINKKRGYKSSRKAKGSEDGVLIDGMDVARKLYEEGLTPGELCLQILEAGKKIYRIFIVLIYRMSLTGFGTSKSSLIRNYFVMQ